MTDQDRASEQVAAPSSEGPGPAPAAFLLMVVGRELRARVEAQLRRDRLSMRLYSALGHLSREPGLSYSELARRAGITVPSVQATLRQLEELGAVERLTEPGRGRSARLQVTPHGHELIRKANEAIHQLDDWVAAQLGGERQQLLAHMLMQLFMATGSRGTS
ncbi:MAG TPA: MarR family transcriptional regulator [Pseudonocardia sp.]|uniref:MarR family winged helix-turn-helix transcriptional regulator n=1 Tax=Pseudonocardia sp. TaxID=60912 RepID=UPI002CDCF083|nr:MarR family transcriptional regulator [Pseudonocardia sp.]HTF45814.1 MarR family transcriptional regulator [Pseudonocardia sp.]